MQLTVLILVALAAIPLACTTPTATPTEMAVQPSIPVPSPTAAPTKSPTLQPAVSWLLAPVTKSPGEIFVATPPNAPNRRYLDATEITLIAIPGKDCTFSHWSEHASGDDPKKTFVIGHHSVVVANFSCPLPIFEGVTSGGPHHQDSGEAKIRESTAGVSRKPSSDCKACGCSSKHLCGLTAWNT